MYIYTNVKLKITNTRRVEINTAIQKYSLKLSFGPVSGTGIGQDNTTSIHNHKNMVNKLCTSQEMHSTTYSWHFGDTWVTSVWYLEENAECLHEKKCRRLMDKFQQAFLSGKDNLAQNLLFLY
jgi:hypothetical protein